MLVTVLVLATSTTAAAGSGWSVVPSPNVGANHDQLNGVSCGSIISCKAVGQYYSGYWRVDLSSPGMAKTWSVSASPNHGTISNSLNAVSCVSATSCKAGVPTIRIVAIRTLVESWNGHTWSIQSSPKLRGTISNSLDGVSCISANSCKAVGDYSNGTYSRTLIESWNGSTWSLSSSPSIGTGNNELGGVSCVSSRFCEAVGQYVRNNVWATLVESWNGTTWSFVSSPNRAGDGDHLHGVSCIAINLCKAVGDYDYTVGDDDKGERTLVESWNGATWSLASSPNIVGASAGTSNDFLNSISCGSTISCQAVGYFSQGSVQKTVTESWNTGAWALSSNPGGNIDLQSVSCVLSLCDAAGAFPNTGGYLRTGIESEAFG